MNCTSLIAAALLVSAFCQSASAQAARQAVLKNIAPALGQVSQVGLEKREGEVYGQGTLTSDGCHVFTALHVAFGVGKNQQGGTLLVPASQLKAGRTLDFQFDLDPKTGQFRHSVKAQVIDVISKLPGDPFEIKAADKALLRIKDCPAGGFASVTGSPIRGPLIDETLTLDSVPSGILILPAVMREKKSNFFYSDPQECRAEFIPHPGLISTECLVHPGMSGGMILELLPNSTSRLVGISTIGLYDEDLKKRTAVGIHAGSLQKMLPGAK